MKGCTCFNKSSTSVSYYQSYICLNYIPSTISFISTIGLYHLSNLILYHQFYHAFAVNSDQLHKKRFIYNLQIYNPEPLKVIFYILSLCYYP